MYSDSIEVAVEGKVSVTGVVSAFLDTAPVATGVVHVDKRGLAEYGRTMTKVLEVLCTIVKNNSSVSSDSNDSNGSRDSRDRNVSNVSSSNSSISNSSHSRSGNSTGARPPSPFESPLECERFFRAFWAAAEVSSRLDPGDRARQQAAVAREIEESHEALLEFRHAVAIGANFRYGIVSCLLLMNLFLYPSILISTLCLA
jgi:hypothetical protein